MSKKSEKPAAAVKTKKHERTTKPSEAERLERARALAANYLEQRDGMDPQLALDVVDSMDAESINELIDEANTAVIERTAAEVYLPIDYHKVPVLVSDENFVEEVLCCIGAARQKNDSEAQYKAIKKVLFAKLRAAIGIDRKVVYDGIGMEPYIGYSSTLDPILLQEAGVDPAVIQRCYKKAPYDDVRFTLPAEMRPPKKEKK